MKKIIISVLHAVILLITPMVVLAAVTFAAPCQYDETFLGELKDKHARLASVEGEKIVVIGGSSMAFGLDSALLEEYTGMPVVNYGLYATIGTKAMLDMSRPYIGKGDIVVICPETDEQTYSLYYNAHSMWQALDCDLSMLKDAGFSNYGKLLAVLPEFTAEKLGFIRTDSKPSPSGIYAESSFNEYGDISVPRPYNEMPAFYDSSMAISLTTDLLNEEFVEYLNEYAAYCSLRGADVYFSFSPINADAVVSTAEDRTEFYRSLGEQLHFPVISDVNDYILDSAYFYDTNFHLNSRGALLRTSLLADDLLRVMGRTERVETVKYTAPTRPEDYFSLKFNSDENAKYYLCEEIEGGLMITGLTEEGKSQTTLQIPRGVDGKAVLAIGDNAFAGSDVLETVIIGEYAAVRSLTTEALAGCPTLQRIEVYVAPSALPVDIETLNRMPEGCSVYIPAEAYSEFATDYFWSSKMKFVETLGE
ncbi:MAG: hypothetical protein E7658_02000 [Ruminococcaceae bacterium]|nr:hypothetical protein [Oscillospiraceae bacterium]